MITTAPRSYGLSNMRLRALAIALLICVGMTASAQLNGNCTVSILNRTAQVDEEGSWVLPQVPSGMGPVRARATCYENGVTRIGQSEFFVVPDNGIVSDIQITFASPVPVPAALRLSSSKSTLQALGETLQLRVEANFGDGSSREVTADPGTAYNSTNPGIVAVSPTGVVTAAGSGTAIVSAMHDGALGLFRVAVAATIDTDRDGMPDDFELANGLNPNNPGDAATDLDGDGLTNVQEFNAGTNPRSADSDGDGLRDGVEIQTGSDPLDPGSMNLAQAVSGIEVNPPLILLFVNSIGGEASVRVQVIGNVIDGTTIDLTARSRGTTYTSSDLLVANFGLVDGQIFAGNPGGAVVTIANSGHVAAVPVSVSTFTPVGLSGLSIPGFANNIDVVGNYVYIAAGSVGLRIVDVTDRRAPRIVGVLDTAGIANDVRVIGTNAVIADGSNGVLVVDVSVPTLPVLRGRVATPAAALDAVVIGTLAYVACGTAGLQVIDVSDAVAPRLLGGTAVGASMTAVDVDGSLAVAATSSGVRVLDVSTPSAPVLVGSVATTQPRGIRLRGATAYVADYEGSLRIVDVSTPSAPSVIGSTPSATGGILNDVEVFDEFVFGADVFFVNGVPIANVEDPRAPRVVGRLDFPFRDDNGISIAVDNTYVYLVAAFNSLGRLGSSGTTALYIGQYRAIRDEGGVPPTARITTPITGASVGEGTSVNVTVAAADDVGVNSVILEVNGTAVGTDTIAPYSFTVSAPIDSTSLDLRAQAIDFGGNIGESEPVLLTVTADTTAPTVQLTSPSAGQKIALGATFTIRATATDPAGIDRVEFLVNGLVVGTSSIAPYQMPYVAPSEPTSLMIRARAYDRAGNIGESSDVLVTIYRDQPPTGSFTLNLPGNPVFSGAEFRVSGSVSDDIGVTSVELFIDGTMVQSRSTTCCIDFQNIRVPAGVSTMTVAIRVIDTVGQSTMLPAQTVLVQATLALGAVDISGYANDVAVQGDRAYVAAGLAGVHVIDIATPTAPAVISTIDTPGRARRLEVSGRYAFVADGPSGLQVIDLAGAPGPRIVATFVTAAQALDITIKPGRAYLATETGVDIIDILDPYVPRRVGGFKSQYPVQAVAVRDNSLAATMLAFRSGCPSGTLFPCMNLFGYDVSNDQAVRVNDVLLNYGDFHTLSQSRMGGPGLYVNGENLWGAFDLANGFVNLRGTYPIGPHYGYTGTHIQGSLAVVSSAERSPARSAVIFSLQSLPAVPRVGAIDFSAFGPYHGTAIDGGPELVYTTGINAYPDDIRNNPDVALSRFYVGRYFTRQDGGTTPPQVSILAPANGATVVGGQTVAIRLTASDDVAVKSVRLDANGAALAEWTVAPNNYLYDIPLGVSSLVLTAVATDFAGNVTTTPPVTLTVAADTTPPTVRVTAPTPRSLIGRSFRLAADAVDDARVAAVEFLVNGAVAGTDTSSPFEMEYTVPAGTTAVSIRARAHDASGNAGESAEVSTSVFVPEPSSMLSIPGAVYDADANGNHAYVTTTAGLYVVDITDPAAAVIVGHAPTTAQLVAIRLLGHYAYATAYISTGVYELRVFDVTNPANPQQVAAGYAAGGALGVSLFTAYTALPYQYGTQDISVPTVVGTGSLTANLGAPIDVFRNRHVVVSGVELRAYDGGTQAASRPILGSNEQFTAVRIKEGHVAVGTTLNTLFMSHDDYFRWAARIAAPAGDVDFLGDVLATTSNTSIRLFDIGDPARPVERAPLSFTAWGSTRWLRSVVLTPTLVVVTARENNDTGSRVYVGRYRTIVDAAGLAPAVTLQGLGFARVGSLFNFRATASDDVGVAGVTFVVNGVDVFTDTVAPFEFNYLIPTGATALAVHARATDFGGAAAISNTVSFTAVP